MELSNYWEIAVKQILKEIEEEVFIAKEMTHNFCTPIDLCRAIENNTPSVLSEDNIYTPIPTIRLCKIWFNSPLGGYAYALANDIEDRAKFFPQDPRYRIEYV